MAIKFDNKLTTLIEAKAIGIELKEQHVKQAVDYAANQGVDWVILTNGNLWMVYKLIFAKPIEKELIVELDFSQLNSRLEQDFEKLYLLCKEGWQKSALGAYHSQQQALSCYFIGSILQGKAVLEVIRRELRRVSPDTKIDIEQIRLVLVNEVIKHEVVKGERAVEASKKVAKAAQKQLRVVTKSGKSRGSSSENSTDENSPPSPIVET